MDRFFAKVRKDDKCWTWVGAKNSTGYGVLHVSGKHMLAHRLSYMIAHDLQELPKGMHVCHKCHNRLCVNPAHLLLGTPAENHAHLDKAGRRARGAKTNTAKLNEDAVREIRKVAFNLEGRIAMMLKYGVSEACVRQAYDRMYWRHVVD